MQDTVFFREVSGCTVITVPRAIREHLGWKPGLKLEVWTGTQGQLVIEPVRTRPRRPNRKET